MFYHLFALKLFATDSTEWKKQDITGYEVKGRRSHCAVTIGDNVMYFGGYNATTKEHFGDVFIVNTGEREREREREREKRGGRRKEEREREETEGKKEGS